MSEIRSNNAPRVAEGHGGADVHLGAIGLHQSYLLRRNIVRHRQNSLVAMGQAGEREPDARVPARALDDDAVAGLEEALAVVRLGCLGQCV